MEIPSLIASIGAYFNSLNLEHVCWSQDLALIHTDNKIVAGFYKVQPGQETFTNCRQTRFILTVVPLVYISRLKERLIEGYTFLLFDTALQTIEWIIPYTFKLSPTYESAILTALAKTNFNNYTFSVLRPQDLVSQEIKDAFFLTLYYLETRLINVRSTKDQVLLALRQVNPEIVTAYRQKLVPFAYQQKVTSTKQGLIFCHGKVHGFDKIPSWVPRDARWWTLDQNVNTNPDFVGRYDSMETLQNLGLFNWDYVLLQNCPVYDSPNHVQKIIRAARWLLKPGGQLLFPKGTSAHFFVVDRYGHSGFTRSEFTAEYQAGKVPAVDEFYNKIKEEELYSEYIPFNRRDLIMIV